MSKSLCITVCQACKQNVNIRKIDVFLKLNIPFALRVSSHLSDLVRNITRPIDTFPLVGLVTVPINLLLVGDNTDQMKKNATHISRLHSCANVGYNFGYPALQTPYQGIPDTIGDE